MSIEELNKRRAYINAQTKEVQKWLLPKINEIGFWLLVKHINS